MASPREFEPRFSDIRVYRRTSATSAPLGDMLSWLVQPLKFADQTHN